MMKILYLTNIPSPYRVDFFNNLGSHCDLTVLFERNDAKNRNREWLQNEFINFKGIFLKGVKFGDDISFSLKVLRYLNLNYDLIVIGGYSTPTAILAILYLKLKNIPFILNADGGFIKSDKKIIYKIKKFLISSASNWLSTSDITTNYLIHYGADKNKIFKYPFTSIKEKDIIEDLITESSKNDIKRELGISSEKVILSVGQVIPRKGFDLLLKSIKKLKNNYKIFIIGGNPTNDLIEIIKENELSSVHFIDFINKEKLQKFYRIADIFVLSTREDIWGLVINEAMSNGLPIITTDKCICGLELIQDNYNGYIVPLENIGELADRIQYLLKNDQHRKEMGRNSLITIREYTIENMAKVHIDIFSYILNTTEVKE